MVVTIESDLGEQNVGHMEDVVESLAQKRASMSQIAVPPIVDDPSEEFVFENVKVFPPKLVFNDAFDGKRFKKTFTIINCGKYPAFVRILQPSSQAFKVKPLKRGQYLPSGLSVTRTMYYSHSNVMALSKACLYLYINEKPVIYNIEVRLISAYVTVTPFVLHFGEIDVGNASKEMTLQLKNIGHRIAPFSINVGGDDLELILEPMKGDILPDEVIDVKVEVLGSSEKCFYKEVWIKTEPPRRVKLAGTFIMPQLLIEFPVSKFNLTLVEFPRTYYGAESSRTIAFSNNSSYDRMYCMVFECGKKLEHLKKARKINDNLKFFHINNYEGRLLAKNYSVLTFTFVPHKHEYFKRDYCQIFIRVDSVNYRDGVVQERNESVKTFPCKSDVGDEYLVSPIENTEEFEDIQLPKYNFIRLCLYGELEEAVVEICPEDFTLSYLEVGETYDRILNIKNHSRNLPIHVTTNIIPSIVLTPSEVFLGPEESTEITISIIPPYSGTRNSNVIFSLIHHVGDKQYNVGSRTLPIEFTATEAIKPVVPRFYMGITPEVAHEVGFLVDDVRFNTAIEKPRLAIVDKDYWKFHEYNTDLIAFPNDRPKCLRPWSSKVPCRTIFSNMPRIVSEPDHYAFTPSQLECKTLNKKKYTDILSKGFGKKLKKKTSQCDVVGDYEVTDTDHLLMKQIQEPHEITSQRRVFYGCVPLPPQRLMLVKITPKYVYLGKVTATPTVNSVDLIDLLPVMNPVGLSRTEGLPSLQTVHVSGEQIAPYTTCTDSFTIENQNHFLIHVSIKALSNSVVIKEKSRIIIEPYKTKDIFFDCISHGYGKFYVPVYIIINDNHIFDGTVFASVVPTTVRCEQKDILIDPTTHRSFFELYNPVNCDIHFSLETQDKNFKMVPEGGVVPSRKKVYCSIMFLPQIDAVYKTEIYLHSQSGAKQVINAICKNERATIGFSSQDIQFKNIPLNIVTTKETVVRNFSDEDIMYFVREPHPMDEITISPANGSLNSKSDATITITAHFKNVLSFDCSVTFVMQDTYEYKIKIFGNVVFPAVFITPQSIQIPKIPLNSYHRHSIKMKNTSAAPNVITFHMDDIPEFTMTDGQKRLIEKGITLQPEEVMELFLEFQPVEPIACSFYLPYKMNHFIGPPVLNDPITVRSDHYFKKNENAKEIVTTDRKLEPLPRYIKTFSIRCAASGDWFSFSSLHLHFNFENDVRCKKRFTITNISKVEHNFIVPFIDNRKYPFTANIDKRIQVELIGRAWKFVLEPNEGASFKIEFSPTSFGTYAIELPIYVPEYSKQNPFNYLKITGEFIRPGIMCSVKYLYFQTITTRERIHKKITLKLYAHHRDCQIEVTASHETLTVKFLRRETKTEVGKPSESVFDSTADYLVKFTPKKECAIQTTISFYCTCDARYEIRFKASVDNCVFASYQSAIKARAAKEAETFESTFPLFPNTENESYYARTMKGVKQDVERWLFSQGFFYKAFYKVPLGIASLPVLIQPLRQKGEQVPQTKIGSRAKGQQKGKGPIPPLVQLLINLVEPNVISYFYEGAHEPCFEGIDGVMYVHTIYKNILRFLDAQGVFVAQLRPEHLLPYSHYVIYMQNILPDKNERERMFSEEHYFLFTKQAWIDLLLRIYKVFVYSRVTKKIEQEPEVSTTPLLVYEEELAEYFEKNRDEFGEEVGESEYKLMMWLEFHFEKQRHLLWDEETSKRWANRKIRHLETDLMDGLPFATLMIAYCPYLIRCFDNFFPMYQNEEDIYHNACLIYETWKRLGLSYDLRPIRIIKPTLTEMEILTTYLYAVLPHFYPTETITFNAPLGDSSSYKLVVRNEGDALIAYTPLFFLDDTDTFSVNPEILPVDPGEVNTLTICYKAKSILKRTAVLVLSGETIGYKFAKTMAFNLVGIPDIHQFSEDFTVKADLFQLTKTTLEVTSPFGIAYDAKISFFFGDQSKAPETLDEFISVSTLISQKIPRQVMMDPECKFTEGGDAFVKLRLCYVACGTYTYYIYFINKDVGDFCIKLDVAVVMKDKCVETLLVQLPNQFSTETCTCSPRLMDLKCPRVIPVEIPSRNRHLIEGLKRLFENCAEEEEIKFWLPLLDYPKGFRILKEYLENSFEEVMVRYYIMLHEKVTYDIRTKLAKKVTVPQNLTIDDVTSNRTYTLNLHWNARQPPTRITLTLIASHEQEFRRYDIQIKKKDKGLSKLSLKQ